MTPDTAIPPGVKCVASWRDVQLVDRSGENLTQWEIDFLDSVMGQLRAGRYLSTKQRARLDIMLEDRIS